MTTGPGTVGPGTAARTVVIGATGGTGRQVVERALAAGRRVAAFVRRPEALPVRHASLEIVQGDVLRPADLLRLVRPGDAVVSALGIGARTSDTVVYSAGTANVVAAMAQAGVRRLVCVSTSGLEVGAHCSPLQRALTRHVLQRVLRRPYADIRRMEDHVRGSDLDWTVVRAARLTGGAMTGRFRVTPSGTAGALWSISRADLAVHLLSVLDDPGSFRTTEDIAY